MKRAVKVLFLFIFAINLAIPQSFAGLGDLFHDHDISLADYADTQNDQHDPEQDETSEREITETEIILFNHTYFFAPQSTSFSIQHQHVSYIPSYLFSIDIPPLA